MISNKILITPYYKTQYKERNIEIDTVLRKNIGSNLFNKIILFCDSGCIPPFINEKIEIVNTNSRPTYLDFFNKGNEYEGNIIVVANSDIFFDKSISLSDEYVKDNKKVLALTRYEYNRVGKFYRSEMIMGCDSQDSWIYLSPININNMSIDFGLGVPGCDNRIAKELSRNYLVKNPSLNIKTYHIHNSNIRTYDPNDRLPGEYLQVHME
jgi:hypothetical protein